MNDTNNRSGLGGATMLGRVASPTLSAPPEPKLPPKAGSNELTHALAEVKGQAQFLLYLADQIEESLGQLGSEADPSHASFLCRVLSMYSAQLETKHQGLGDRIAETCQEIYVTVREYDLA
ncbi:MAG: hypothetical protein ABI353_02420 [Isosphaeraceae bacterium]